MQWQRASTLDSVTIGVVGPRDLVQRILMMQAGADSRRWRLVGAAHSREGQAYEQARRIADGVDVVLFTGPLQYDLARESGDLPVPTTHITVSGASLYSSIIRGLMTGTLDPSRVSIDSIPPDDVAAAYADIDVSTEHVHVLEYQDSDSVEKFVGFHRDLHQRGATSAALTTVKSVATRLTAAGVPAYRLVPPAQTIRIALDTAALLGAGSILGDSQIVMVVVQVAPAYRPVRTGPQDYRRLELVLSLHRLLLSEVADLGVGLVKRDADTFSITATRGSLPALLDRLRAPDLAERVRLETGMALDVGVGVGDTPQAAESHAYQALERSRESEAGTVYMVRSDGSALVVSGGFPGTPSSEPSLGRSKAAEMLRRIIEVLPQEAGEPVVVDAETVAEGLSVTPRSARRMLASLVDAGLAWPMPSLSSSKGGRPRQQFRLVVE